VHYVITIFNNVSRVLFNPQRTVGSGSFRFGLSSRDRTQNKKNLNF
jgi:hypothetical protein